MSRQPLKKKISTQPCQKRMKQAKQLKLSLSLLSSQFIFLPRFLMGICVCAGTLYLLQLNIHLPESNNIRAPDANGVRRWEEREIVLVILHMAQFYLIWKTFSGWFTHPFSSYPQALPNWVAFFYALLGSSILPPT